MQETWVQTLSQEDLLEKGMAIHSSILAWEIPWTEEPGKLQSIGLQRVRHYWATNTFTFFLFFFLIFFLLYNTVLVLPYIDMNPPWVYMSSQPWTPLPPYIISLGHPSAPAPSILYPASNLDWRFVSYMILYMFQCHFPKSSHSLPLPQSPKSCSIHLLLSHIQGYRYHLSKFHIYALVYCIGGFIFSDLLHSG